MVSVDERSPPTSNGLTCNAPAECAILYLSSEPGDNVAVTVSLSIVLLLFCCVQTTATNESWTFAYLQCVADLSTEAKRWSVDGIVRWFAVSCMHGFVNIHFILILIHTD